MLRIFTYTDKNTPEEIYATFGISKKIVQKSVGELYKRRLITIEEEGIRPEMIVSFPLFSYATAQNELCG